MNPFSFFILELPSGICTGFITVTLPFILVNQGFSVSQTALITALGVSANVFRFIWAPLVDLTMSYRRWYLLSVILCSSSIILIGLIPIRPGLGGILALVAFLSQIASTFIIIPVTGLMAKTVHESSKGRAGGWFQAGNLGGTGLGGGAGVWITSHYSYETACILLSLMMLLCLSAFRIIPKIHYLRDSLKDKWKILSSDILNLFRSAKSLFTIFVILTPVGVGAASMIWSSAAKDWNASANLVALVTGTLSGIANILGCIAGGWIADKLGKWWAYFGSGSLLALVSTSMAFSSFAEMQYLFGVLSYAFIMGINYAAFTAVVLYAIGSESPCTKSAVLTSLGNVPVTYMATFDGWMHDSYGVKAMLLSESVLGLACVLFLLGVLNQLKKKNKII